ncbi:MAG TPA: SDR family NAD(P)-dependent oxidoreductase [Bacteroidales bacterium]|jgi:NAD(P)-dependent dehydrogenase (short-subunit alcohol dehydrogenase family)/rhamnose utilization protein RhaD (predicted bifunctional aldolase and dehydrogenase)|nr:SDR family NAD(P)-dependent oxidoreductase [Bacteroidales bacterium]HNR42312.1 SDR family NAD(P)-dependent oxidoreductase [Bacteroidales bacterium]HPM19147.1 SDR family NAD(P)-dependent oxidoreductase [Bacteroidales bacterium]HQG76666.1 SDR family NAD(P)-dependent oxidoreductase [Bacteroidales bacterium]
MTDEIRDLLEISRYYGRDKNYVIAGGGNSSFKDDRTIWIKASGQALSDLDETGLVALSREKIRAISLKKYPDDPAEREECVKRDLQSAITGTGSPKRPSVETSLHELIGYRFVVHLHPTSVNGIMCSRNAGMLTAKLFGEKALFVPYTDPGYTLFKKLESDLESYREKHEEDPTMIFLENHGVFVSGNTVDGIRSAYDKIISAILNYLGPLPPASEISFNPVLHKVLPVMRMLFAEKNPKIIRYRHNTLIEKYYQNQKEFHRISLPLTPDIIVYCKTRYLYVENSATPEKIIDSLKQQLPAFRKEYGYMPKIVVIKDAGIFAVEDSVSAAETVLDVYEDMIRIVSLSSEAGGTKTLTPEQVAFIDQWEVENYRRKIALAGKEQGKLNNRVAVITGGAQGFGAGIAESLFEHSVNVVVADLNEETGMKLVSSLNARKSAGRALFVRTDVASPDSVKDLVAITVREFGGIDIMISNAGILRAGGLDETDPGDFEKTTSVNYNGYFHCAKYASEIMKLQNREKPDYFTDIIQINSKSGLRGSNRNFAYSGGKFGGIGLTQSFALELAPFRIKVNAVCPGNFYEGPLWSDPGNGLFVQYLRTGKVPGAKTIDDVRKFYEEQVPMKRGCRLVDVVKAVLYIIDQEYETGQAVPVTGGQVMLG